MRSCGELECCEVVIDPDGAIRFSYQTGRLRVPPGQRHPTFDPNLSSPHGSGQAPGTPTGCYPATTVGGMA